MNFKSFSEAIQYDGCKYWVRLSWHTDPSKLPTNFRMAVGQLKSLQQQLSRRPDKLQHYQRVIEEYVRNDFIEEVVNPSVQGHCLPNHGVVKDPVTTPLRVVFNARAKVKSSDQSLNNVLETGPSLTEKLIDSLLNFRVSKFALVGDISKAFLCIGLQEIDRDYVRFYGQRISVCPLRLIALSLYSLDILVHHFSYKLPCSNTLRLVILSYKKS